VGSAAVVMADVGPDSVVGAGAVVTRPLPARVIAAGIPARVLRHRSGDPAAGLPPGEQDESDKDAHRG
jgi:acetyltransferase-like isoleucine patch superfamily enzyme